MCSRFIQSIGAAGEEVAAEGVGAEVGLDAALGEVHHGEVAGDFRHVAGLCNEPSLRCVVFQRRHRGENGGGEGDCKDGNCVW